MAPPSGGGEARSGAVRVCVFVFLFSLIGSFRPAKMKKKLMEFSRDVASGASERRFGGAGVLQSVRDEISSGFRRSKCIQTTFIIKYSTTVSHPSKARSMDYSVLSLSER